jgi:CRP-like cAMP-binding protein
LQGASKAKEFTSTLSRGPREFLVAVRSEGQFVGEMASFTTAAVRCATVRAKGNVRVRLIPGELLHDCVERIPEVRTSVSPFGTPWIPAQLSSFRGGEFNSMPGLCAG